MASRGARKRVLAAGLGTVALACPTVAVAAANSVAIQAPHHAKVGVKFDYVVTGDSASRGNRLATFLNTGVRCKATFTEEEASAYGITKVAERVRKGHFSRGYTATPRSTGTHYVCAYLFNGSSKTTLARASSKYVTKA